MPDPPLPPTLDTIFALLQEVRDRVVDIQHELDRFLSPTGGK